MVFNAANNGINIVIFSWTFTKPLVSFVVAMFWKKLWLIWVYKISLTMCIQQFPLSLYQQSVCKIFKEFIVLYLYPDLGFKILILVIFRSQWFYRYMIDCMFDQNMFHSLLLSVFKDSKCNSSNFSCAFSLKIKDTDTRIIYPFV